MARISQVAKPLGEFQSAFGINQHEWQSQNCQVLQLHHPQQRTKCPVEHLNRGGGHKRKQAEGQDHATAIPAQAKRNHHGSQSPAAVAGQMHQNNQQHTAPAIVHLKHEAQQKSQCGRPNLAVIPPVTHAYNRQNPQQQRDGHVKLHQGVPERKHEGILGYHRQYQQPQGIFPYIPCTLRSNDNAPAKQRKSNAANHAQPSLARKKDDTHMIHNHGDDGYQFQQGLVTVGQ